MWISLVKQYIQNFLYWKKNCTSGCPISPICQVWGNYFWKLVQEFSLKLPVIKQSTTFCMLAYETLGWYAMSFTCRWAEINFQSLSKFKETDKLTHGFLHESQSAKSRTNRNTSGRKSRARAAHGAHAWAHDGAAEPSVSSTQSSVGRHMGRHTRSIGGADQRWSCGSGGRHRRNGRSGGKAADERIRGVGDHDHRSDGKKQRRKKKNSTKNDDDGPSTCHRDKRGRWISGRMGGSN